MFGPVDFNLRNSVFSDTARNFRAAGLIPIFFLCICGIDNLRQQDKNC